MVEVDIDTFDSKVIQASQHTLVLLDISAEWCGPCKIITPILHKAEEIYGNHVTFTKLEAEAENMKIAGHYGIKGFPTILAIHQGKELDRFHGAKSWPFVQTFIDNNLGNISQ